MDVRIGKTSFNRTVLAEMSTLTEAKERFKNIDPEIVKRAYYEVHTHKKRKVSDKD